MTATSTKKPLPPGRRGLPLLGETLTFAKDPFQFVEDKITKHGRVFRSRIFGQDTVVIAGADATSRFIDPNIVMRKGSQPAHLQELLGGQNIHVLDLIDGEVHKERKRVVLQAFTHGALA